MRAGACARKSIGATLGIGMALAAVTAANAHDTNYAPPQRPLSIKSMGSFTVGGEIKATDGTPGGLFGSNSNTGHIAVNQMYVQYQVPTGADAHVPVVLIHGGTLSGSSYETTPDGRMGWLEYFLRNDRAVYVPDQASRGRSGFDVTGYNHVRLGLAPVSTLPEMFVFTEEQGWLTFRFGPKFGTTFKGLQYPIQAADNLARQTIPDINAVLPTPNPTLTNLAQLGRQLKGAILLGHSESGLFPEQAALTDPTGIKGMISVEPGDCTSLIPTSKEVKALAKIPTLIVYGDNIEAAGTVFPNWPQAFKGCQTYVATINKAGGHALLLHLPDVGVKGNSHMMMQDKNNLQVASLILSWIDKNVEPSNHKPGWH